MIALLSGVALASLLGSAHCAGMCGGLTAIYAGRDPGRRQSPFRAHAGYSGGRLVAYTGLGALAGLAGSLLDLAGSLAGIQRVAAVGAGILILAWGLRVLRDGSVRLPDVPAPRLVRDAMAAAFGWLGALSAPTRGLVLGLLSGLLPCGWLWAFLITAAGTGHPGGGALVMTAFWAGTLPALLGLGLSLRALAGRLHRWRPVAGGLALVLLGLLALAGRLVPPPGGHAELVRHRPASPAMPETGHAGH